MVKRAKKVAAKPAKKQGESPAIDRAFPAPSGATFTETEIAYLENMFAFVFDNAEWNIKSAAHAVQLVRLLDAFESHVKKCKGYLFEIKDLKKAPDGR